MALARRAGAITAVVLLLGSLWPSLAFSQAPPSRHQSTQLATVVLTVDLRELTSLRDLPHVGDVLFRRIGVRESRARDDYDIAIRGSVAADWKSAFGGSDANRAPHVLSIQPGTYFIEKINIGSGPTTIGSGIDPQTQAPRFGSFVVREGEVINLGRLVVHMHWHEGYFDAKVEDNTAEARSALADSNRDFAARMQTRLLKVTPKFAFQPSGGRL
jgi:hypothetical protein